MEREESSMTTVRPRRTELAVPASNQRFLHKAASSVADAVILDLEDGVAPSARPEARANVVEALNTLDWGRRLRTVRVNDVRTQWFYQDLIAVVEGAGRHLDAIVLPKVNRPEDVYMLDLLLGQIEMAKGIDHRIGIEAQIETAEGMAAVEQIARASTRLQTLIFGPGDYAASIGAPMLSIGGHVAEYPGHIWHAALSRIVVAAKAAGLEAIDGPFGAYKDMAGLEQSARLARLLGCDGKWAIHPSQLEPINAIFAPSAEELARAQEIVQQYQSSLAEQGRGAISLQGDLIDAASLRMAERVLARGQVAGNTGSSPVSTS
jgi:citrate lyase subunit beta / citryl-CoA lyase